MLRSASTLLAALGLLLTSLGTPAVRAASRGDFAEKRAKIRRERSKLRALAEADKAKRAESAAAVIAELVRFAGENRVKGQKAELSVLAKGLNSLQPELVPDLEAQIEKLPDPPQVPDAAAAQKWKPELQRRREAIVSRAGSLLNKSVKMGLTDLAYDFLQEILAFDPDRQQLRKNLGQLTHKGKWYSRFDHALARKGVVWDETLGWIREGKQAPYDKGYYYEFDQARWRSLSDLARLKYDKRRWLPLDKANEAHSNYRKPWTIRTQHLEIRGNADLRILVEAANRLEQFYAQIFAAYAHFFTNKKDDYRLILGMADHPPLVVYIYRNKEDYVRIVGQRYEWSAGLFMHSDKACYFYGRISSAMYHEFTHQILHVFSGGNSSPPWLTEAIATYTQFPTFKGEKLVLGRLGANRAVLQHLVAYRSGKHMPLEDLLKIVTYQQWTNVTTENSGNYPAAGALAYFCMEADHRAYRADFIDFVRDSYRGPSSTRGHKLWEYLGMDEEEFGKAYGKWLDEASQQMGG